MKRFLGLLDVPNKSWSRILLTFFLTIALATSIAIIALASHGAREAEAHRSSDDAVRPDSGGGTIVWSNRTRYINEILHADEAWNELDCRWGNNCPGVNIVQNGTFPATVRISEYCNSRSSTLAYVRPGTDPDGLYVNQCRYDRVSSSLRRAVMTHEFGHLLRFAHTTCSSYYLSNSIMVPGGSSSCLMRYTTPRPHDDADYYNTWIR